MKIVSADITGSLIVNGVDVTTNVVSSSIFSGSIAGRVTNLEAFSASLDATFATDASVSASILVLSQSVQTSQAALSSSFALTSGSYAAASASLSTRVTDLEQFSSSLDTIFATDAQVTASILVLSQSVQASEFGLSSSLSTRLTTDETNISTLTSASSSFAAQSASLSGRVNIIEGQDATTGSNTFTGVQYISQASNAIGFTSTASLYTDGGLRVAKDSFVSGTAYFNNITVYGTSSIQYITSSQVNIGSNIITVNTDTPAVRFGGLSVFDSGSTQLTGSIFWDSEKNHWIYSNPSGSSYNSGMIMSGPRNSGSLGDEQGTTFNALMKGQGGDHITSSQVIDDGTTVRIPGNFQVTGSLSGSSATFSGNVGIGTAAPSYKLQVNGASGTIARITDGTNNLDFYAGSSLNEIAATTSLLLSTNNATRLTIASTGLATFSNSIVLSATGYVGFGGGTNYIEGDNTNNILRFGTNNVTRLTLASTGAATFSSSVTANATSTFSNASSLSAIFSNGGNPSNYNSIELRGGTAGTAVNWQISKDNSTSNAFELAPSTTAGGTTYGSPVLKILNTGAATFSGNVDIGTGDSRLTIGNTSLANTEAKVRLRTGSTKIAWEIGGQSLADNALTITPSTAAGGTTFTTPALTISSTGAATFSSSVTAAALTIGSLGSGSNAVLTLATNASGSPRTIYYKASDATINITGTGGTDLMTITNGGNVLIGTTTSNSFNFVASPNGHSFLGNTMQISAGDYGGTERQGAIGVAEWANETSAVINLASIFPRITFSSRALSVLVQIGTSNNTTSQCSALVLFSRTINSGWSSTIIANINNGGTTLNSVSGSGTSITLNFNNANFGSAMITILNRA